MVCSNQCVMTIDKLCTRLTIVTMVNMVKWPGWAKWIDVWFSSSKMPLLKIAY